MGLPQKSIAVSSRSTPTGYATWQQRGKRPTKARPPSSDTQASLQTRSSSLPSSPTLVALSCRCRSTAEHDAIRYMSAHVSVQVNRSDLEYVRWMRTQPISRGHHVKQIRSNPFPSSSSGGRLRRPDARRCLRRQQLCCASIVGCCNERRKVGHRRGQHRSHQGGGDPRRCPRTKDVCV